MTDIKENLKKVHKRVAQATKKANRCPNDVLVMAVTKRHSVDRITRAAALGQRDFGENFLQEAQQKIQQLAHQDLNWHFIGRVQSNKTRIIADLFDWVHTVDRVKIAQRLSAQRAPQAPPLNICLQVNIASDEVKAGVRPEAVADLAHAVAPLPGLRLRGLMCVPPFSDDEETQRGYFSKVRGLFEQIDPPSSHWDTLSMGMSGDLESAIFEGATIVRIGTALFGPRP